jgi:hypothetical protein
MWNMGAAVRAKFAQTEADFSRLKSSMVRVGNVNG